jgi:hypothetical protein
MSLIKLGIWDRNILWSWEISSSNGGEYEDDSFLGYSAVLSAWSRPAFQRFVVIPSSPWWRKQYASLKRRSTSTRLHSAVSQKAVIFILSSCLEDSDTIFIFISVKIYFVIVYMVRLICITFRNIYLLGKSIRAYFDLYIVPQNKCMLIIFELIKILVNSTFNKFIHKIMIFDKYLSWHIPVWWMVLLIWHWNYLILQGIPLLYINSVNHFIF